ncbi:hypothetical protein CC2G_006793 [Coprinopsis cinerea AmutBmut pab1-1]|nr:hypothetical protein CC2G_006793 [Coprinopsis cinerea AmutBmut pab1-1]
MFVSFLGFSSSSPLAQIVNLGTLSMTAERRANVISSFLEKCCEKFDMGGQSRPRSEYNPNIHYVFDLLPYDPPQPLATISDEARQDQFRSLQSRISMVSSRLKTLEGRIQPGEKAASLWHRAYCESYALYALACECDAEAFLHLQEEILRLENAVADLEIRFHHLALTRAWKE